MIKQFRYLLSALLCAALLLAPVWAIGEEDDEESLRWLLSRQTDQESFDYFFYGDYDGDGVHEAFALVGYGSRMSDNPSGTMWFVSPKCVEKVDEERSYGTIAVLGEDGNKLFSAEEWYGGSGSVVRLWQVSRGVPKKVETALDGSITYAGDGVFLAHVSAFDMYSDGTGHTWKPYYYFLNDDGLHEYGGAYLPLDQLQALDGAEEILQQKQAAGWIIDTVIYRGNGIINVNMHDSSSGSLTRYDNLTLRREGDRVVDTGESYGGVYMLANTPSIAVAPDASSADESGAIRLICSKETEDEYFVYLQNGDNRLWLDSFPEDYPAEYYDFSLELYRLQNGAYFIYSGFENSSYRVVTFEDGEWKQLCKIEDPNYSDGAALIDPDTGKELYYLSNDDLTEMHGNLSEWMDGILNELFAEYGIRFGSNGMQVSGEFLIEATGKQLIREPSQELSAAPKAQKAPSQEESPSQPSLLEAPSQEKSPSLSNSQENSPLIREDECEIQWSSARVGNKYDVRGVAAIDGRLDTAWNTNDAGVGEWLSFTATGGARELAGFRIVNGYAKDKGVYSKNARVRTFALYCDEQLVERFELEDNCALQTFWLEQPAIGTSFQFVAEQVYNGSKYRDLCVTEIELLGVNNEDFHTHALSDWGRSVEALEQRLNAGDSLSKGSKGYEVMGLQLLLGRGFGLLSDAADGAFGKNTESALIQLQQLLRASNVSAQLEPMRDGVADGAFIRNLQAYLENQ